MTEPVREIVESSAATALAAARFVDLDRGAAELSGDKIWPQ